MMRGTTMIIPPAQTVDAGARDRLRRDRILYLASWLLSLSSARLCGLRLGLLTTDLLRARRVPRPRGTCQRFRFTTTAL